MASDRLVLKKMVFYGYHGAFAAEKELGQQFEVDVELYLDLKSAAAADDLELSVNYVEVYTLVKEIVEEREFSLIETLAETIAGEILSAYTVEEAVVRVRKPFPPSGGILDHVEVEISRKP
ncbi:MAG TPA: dihydroneopterin aldolase [Firmicutes bacterium]|nr:dihydroneopterin aldolase [Bacillota bacterium]